MTETKLINPTLHSRLRQAFGQVKVTNEGIRGVALRGFDAVSRRPRLFFLNDEAGEYFRVCCPYCGDSRFRLYIHHLYGQRDLHHRQTRFLSVCFNEACLSDPRNRDDLWLRLDSRGGGSLQKARIYERDRRPSPPPAWPGTCIPVADLPDDHFAVAYLRERRFDPLLLSRVYGVRYCEECVSPSQAAQRLIIPVVRDGRLVGWQGRYVGERDWKDKDGPTKYHTMYGFRKSRHIYNYDVAKTYRTLVLVEGVTDVWRFGPMAGCTFGDSLSDVQYRRVASGFRGFTVVLLYDPEAFEEDGVQRAVLRLKTTFGRDFCPVLLPEGTDPGSLDREFLWPYVREQAAKAGVKVSYAKRHP